MQPDEVADHLSFVVQRDWEADEWVLSWYVWHGSDVLKRSGILRYDAQMYDGVELERLVHAAMAPLMARLGSS